MSTAEELFALAEKMQIQEGLERDYDAALQNYRDNPEDPVFKEAYRDLADRLRQSRFETRSAGVSLVPNTPGSVTIGTNTIGRTRGDE